MLSLVVFAFLQCLVYIVTGANFFSKPSLYSNNGGSVPIALTGTAKPIIQDAGPAFGLKPYLDVLTDSKRNFASGSLQPSELSFQEWSSQDHNEGIPLVEYFAFHFIESVKASEKMQKAFQLQEFTAKSLSSLINELVLKGHLSVGNPEAELLAEIASRAVADNFYKVKEDTLLRVVAYYLARYLFVRGALTTSNVGSLSQKYFMMSKKNIDSIAIPNPIENITALGKAMVDYLVSLNLFTPFTAHMVAGGFANEWYRYMFVRGALARSNIKSLAQTYFMMSKRNIDSIAIPNPIANVTK